MNIKTIEIRLWAFSNLEQPRAKSSFQTHYKILLFQYSERTFSANERAATSTLLQDARLITLFLTPYKLSQNSSFSQRYNAMNIETI